MMGMNTALQQWENGSRKIDPPLREQLILEYAPLIKYIAQRLAVRLPANIEVDDLINSGIIGLIDAIEKFDPTKGVKFRTYAEFRVKGSMLDELRSLDLAPRSLRNKIHQMNQASEQLEQKLGRKPSDEELATTLDINVEAFHKIVHQANGVSLISLEELGYTLEDGQEKSLDFIMDEYRQDPSLRLRINEIKEIIAKAINELKKKQRLVITLYYYEELTMKEIGVILGITESRVSQLRTQAIKQLRAKLKQTITE